MKLLTLTLTNFKSFRNLTIEAGGKDLNIYGTNGVGKTTIADALLWLFFGKDTANRADDTKIKTLSRGKVIHHLDHSVEASFEIEGATLTLKKTYAENWKQERGRATKEFSGHNTTYFINSVSVGEAAYLVKIREIGRSEQMFRMLSDPLYFQFAMKWEDRRRILMEACGDISDAEVIEAHESLAALPAILGANKLDEYKQIINAKCKKINEEIQYIPKRIDEVNLSLPAEVKGHPSGEVAQYEATVRALQERRASANAGGAIAEQVKRLAEIDGELITIVNASRGAGNPARDAALAKSREYAATLADWETKIGAMKRKLASQQTELEGLDKQLETLRAERDAWKTRNYVRAEYTPGETTCTTCGQELPAHLLSSREQAFNRGQDEQEAAFNLQKSNALTAIIERGRAAKTQREELAAEIATNETKLARAEHDRDMLQAEANALVIPAEEDAADPKQSPAYLAKSAERQDVANKLAALRIDSADAIAAIDAEIAEAQSKLTAAQAQVAAQDARTKGLARIAELEAQEKALASEYELLQGHKFLCEEFVRLKVAMLTEKIEGKFQLASFRLFKEQINGGLTECCDVLWRENGAPPSHAQGINLGLDIINTLSEQCAFAPPIVIDDAESLAEILPTAGQQIRLIVSPKDAEIRIDQARELAYA